MSLKKTDDAILEAAQLIDKHVHYLHVNGKEFFAFLNKTDLWEICDINFSGSEIGFNYNDTTDTNRFFRVSLHKYVEWRGSKR